MQTDERSSASAVEMLRTCDWASTPLGPREGWPQSLITAVDMMMANGHAMCIAWGPERTFLYNESYVPMLGARHPSAMGKQFAEVWPEIWSEIEPLVEATFEGKTSTFEDLPLTMTRHGYPEETWWSFSYSPVRDEEGKVAGLLNVTLETTNRVNVERQRDAAIASLRESENFMRSVLSASTDCIKVLDLDGGLTFISDGGLKVMEISDFNAVKGCAWLNFMKGEGVSLAQQAIEAAKAGRSFHFEAPADTYLGNPKFWSVSVSPIFGENGQVERILSVSRDHTSLEEAREQQRLLNGELNHRLKNVLTIVQSIANQTMRDATTLEEASAAFSSRLASLGRATDVLTATSWEAADLSAVLDAGLLVIEGKRQRVTLAGPTVRLGPQAALALTLAVHELSTNALKYGALSNDDGLVTLCWDVTGSNDDQRFNLLWQERHGPAVSPPTRRGFGSRMIERSLRSYFRGETTLSYPVEGVEFRIDAPLSGAGELVTASWVRQ